jgi:hypothetical protein
VRHWDCDSSDFSHWWPFLPLTAGLFRCHLERALTIPLAGLVYVYYFLWIMMHLLGWWCLFGHSLLGFPLFGVLCAAIFPICLLKYLDVILTLLFLGQICYMWPISPHA